MQRFHNIPKRITEVSFKTTLFASFLFMNACLPSEKRFLEEDNDGMTIFCPGDLPECYRCMEADFSTEAPATYCVPELIGNWYLNGSQLCIKLFDNGRGELINLQTNEQKQLFWGVLIDETGALINENGKWTVYFNGPTYLQTTSPYELSYTIATGKLGADGVKNGTCSLDKDYRKIIMPTLLHSISLAY